MEPTDIRFGGGAADTILHPLVAVILLFTIASTCFAPRKHVIAPWLLTALLVPFGQVVVLGGVHFTAYRLIVLFGLLRLAITRPPRGTCQLAGGFGAIDRAFTLFSFFSFITFSLQWMEMQAFIKSTGSLIDTLGGYFVLRFLIRDRQTVHSAIKVLIVIAIVLAACMTNEHLTKINVFGLLGGSPPLAVVVREGKIRASGSFANYITAGAFGATLLPLCILLWSDAKVRILASFGILGATLMTLTCNSSTPLLAYAAGIVGLCFWPLRRRMRALRWLLVLILVGLHVAMTAPVWALIARIDLTGASSGYHRFMLVDQCIRHLQDWWLIGVKNYNAWGPDMWDLSNQYVAYAVTGGVATIVAFIIVISLSFRGLGASRRLVDEHGTQAWFLWCLGAALLSHLVAFFGVCYFDQVQVAWYALLAIIVVASSEGPPLPVPHAEEHRFQVQYT